MSEEQRWTWGEKLSADKPYSKQARERANRVQKVQSCYQSVHQNFTDGSSRVFKVGDVVTVLNPQGADSEVKPEDAGIEHLWVAQILGLCQLAKDDEESDDSEEDSIDPDDDPEERAQRRAEDMMIAEFRWLQWWMEKTGVASDDKELKDAVGGREHAQNVKLNEADYFFTDFCQTCEEEAPNSVNCIVAKVSLCESVQTMRSARDALEASLQRQAKRDPRNQRFPVSKLDKVFMSRWFYAFKDNSPRRTARFLPSGALKYLLDNPTSEPMFQKAIDNSFNGRKTKVGGGQSGTSARPQASAEKSPSHARKPHGVMSSPAVPRKTKASPGPPAHLGVLSAKHSSEQHGDERRSKKKQAVVSEPAGADHQKANLTKLSQKRPRETADSGRPKKRSPIPALGHPFNPTPAPGSFSRSEFAGGRSSQAERGKPEKGNASPAARQVRTNTPSSGKTPSTVLNSGTGQPHVGNNPGKENPGARRQPGQVKETTASNPGVRRQPGQVKEATASKYHAPATTHLRTNPLPPSSSSRAGKAEAPASATLGRKAKPPEDASKPVTNSATKTLTRNAPAPSGMKTAQDGQVSSGTHVSTEAPPPSEVELPTFPVTEENKVAVHTVERATRLASNATGESPIPLLKRIWAQVQLTLRDVLSERGGSETAGLTDPSEILEEVKRRASMWVDSDLGAPRPASTVLETDSCPLASGK